MNYSNTFKEILHLIGIKYFTESATWLEAKTHEFIIEHCSEEFQKKSFNAVVIHLRIESKADFQDEKAYINVFKDKNFCKRILSGQNI
jgi:hypothetical protein